MSRLIRFDFQRDPKGLLAQRIAALRPIIRSAAKDVLATSTDALPTAALAWATWSEGRRLVFAPTDQAGAVAELMESKNLLALSGEESDAYPIDAEITVPADAVLVEFYTSGSTGKPLRVLKSERQLFGEAKYLSQHFGISEEDILLSGVPARHLYGFLFSVMIPHVSGCLVVDKRPQYPASIRELSSASGATIFVSTPGQLHALSAAAKMPEVRVVFSSGARLRSDARVALEEHGLRVVEIFGSTETGGIACREDSGPWTPFLPVVVDASEMGNLLVKSVFLESPDNFLECQDRVEIIGTKFRDLGRSDDIVKVGGKRVSVDTIKELLLAHPRVQACAVLAQEHPRVRLHAFVVAAADVTPVELRERLLETLDPVTIPRIHLVGELPYTELGKVSRKSLENLLTASERDIEVLSTTQDSQERLEVEFMVHANCFYFEGHFEEFPILSGIAQLKFVERHISSIWKQLEHPIRFERLKYKAPIFPDTLGVMTLVRKEGTVSFKLGSEEHINTSGDIVYYD